MANGVKIRKGTEIKGQIVDVTSNTNGVGQRVSLQFDKISLNGQWVPIVTDLRALASSVEVMEAHVPEEAPNEGSPYIVVENYRDGHAIAVRNQQGRASTEDMRKAMLNYRKLFEELVGLPEGEPAERIRL